MTAQFTTTHWSVVAAAGQRQEFVGAGKQDLFEALKVFLTGEKRAVSYAELALKLGTTEAALKMAVSRMRQRYGQLLTVEVISSDYHGRKTKM